MHRTVGFVVLAVLGAIATGIVYEREQRREDERRLPRVGRAVDIEGRSLNIYCSGEGSPTVILSAGAPFSGFSWTAVQREIAKFTQACWYDRAGYGWSDPGPDPLDSSASAKDLHKLLSKAEVAGPYILVGERFAALDMRVYAGRYPSDVVALVQVDPIPDDEVTNPRSRGTLPQFLRYPQNLLGQTLNQVGLIRLMGLGEPRQRFNGRPASFSPREWATIMALRNEPKTRTALLQEQAGESISEAHAVVGLRNKPVIELHSDDGNPMLFYSPDAVAGAVRRLVLH